LKSRREDNLVSVPRRVFFYGYVVVAAVFIIQMISFSINDSFGVFVDPWVNSFGWTRAAISGAYSISFLIMGVMGIVMGLITDKYSPRAALTLCAFCLGGGFIFVSRMHSQWQLYLAYGVIFGTGMSGVWAPLLSLISRWFVKQRGLMTGIVISGGGLGAFIGPPLITWLIGNFSWQQATLYLGIVILAIVLIAAQFLKRDPSVGRQTTLVGINQESKPRTEVQTFTVRQAMASSQFWLIFLVFFCLAYYTFSILVHLMAHAVQLNVSTNNAAFILASISGMSIIGNFVMGPVGDRIGPRKVLMLSFILMSAALFWLVFAREIWGLFLFSIVFGFNHGGNATAQAPLVARIFGLKAHGTIFGAVAFGFTIGGAIGPLITGYIFDRTESYGPAFILCGIVGLIGLALTSILKPTQRLQTEI